ncbi:hypothetical protein BCR36DRAFT_327522 [Piromyces finnis]|uniref:G-protein coupled receptors family 3 profile domain-containing protein n=1 Tax=Piromyces finnis TaxID=1754191 RepID=A0A1Y1V8T1_9FUNG|nr:hypothetical protein BCR36DRAFT_327522 [Piromyces finnis]|eukprot:ORX50033.1 hypothetical protein BCR36DRAFT_327522 [Piromyces finnis]
MKVKDRVYFSYSYIIYIIFIILCLLSKTYGQEEDTTDIIEEEEEVYDPNVINILMKSPDMEDARNITEIEYEYENMINNYLIEKNKNNEMLKDIRVSITFFDYIGLTANGGTIYYRYFYEAIAGIEEQYYDMVVLDDKILFSELEFMETEYYYHLGYRHPSLELLLDLTDYVKMNSINFNDPSILEDAIYKDRLYGLPYELDFDVMYYDPNNEVTKRLSDEMDQISWDKLYSSISSTSNLSIGLGDDYDVLQFLMEYTGNKYELSKEYDPEFFEVFINDTARDVFTSFYNYIDTYTGGNIENSTRISLGTSYKAFLDGESAFFKGKASHNPLFRSNDNDKTIPMTLLPKNVSAVTEKFLCISQFSKKENQILLEIALQLTSKDIQLHRSEHFGSIPTFDLDQKESDPDIKLYCQKESLICKYIENMKRIKLKNVFKSKYSSPLFEIMVLLPKLFRTNLLNNNIDNIIYYFKNIKYLITNNMGIVGVFSYIIVIFFSIINILVIFLVHKYKNHPYIKVISPMFCNMILVGTLISMVKILKYLPPYSIFKSKLFYCLEALSINLIYIPMFAITYRIYKIFKSNIFIAETLTNLRMFLFIITVILIIFLYRFILACSYEFYYFPYGSFRDTRFPDIMPTYSEIHNSIYNAILYAVFIGLLFMIITTGGKSKRFGDVCYTFVIFGLNISNFIVQRLLLTLSDEYFYSVFLLIVSFNCLTHFFCIHFLVGSRILLILLNPSTVESNVSKVNTTYLKEFIPLKRNNAYVSLIGRFKKNNRRQSNALSTSLNY